MLHQSPPATDFLLLLSTILAFLVDASAVIVTVVAIVPVGVVVRHGGADPTHGDIQVVTPSAGKGGAVLPHSAKVCLFFTTCSFSLQLKRKKLGPSVTQEVTRSSITAVRPLLTLNIQRHK